MIFYTNFFPKNILKKTNFLLELSYPILIGLFTAKPNLVPRASHLHTGRAPSLHQKRQEALETRLCKTLLKTEIITSSRCLKQVTKIVETITKGTTFTVKKVSMTYAN